MHSTKRSFEFQQVTQGSFRHAEYSHDSHDCASSLSVPDELIIIAPLLITNINKEVKNHKWFSRVSISDPALQIRGAGPPQKKVT